MQELIEQLLSSMLNEFSQKQPESDTYIRASLMQLLLLVHRHNSTQIEYNTEYINSTHKIINEAIGYINNNFADDITLESISNRFFVSTAYFSRIFKKSTGLTFIEYLNSVRIKEAQKLLATTNLSISEISERIGYKSNTHFGRILKKISHLSPREYRKLDDI